MLPARRRAVRRAVCQHCLSFVSYRAQRLSDGSSRAVVGCRAGGDMVGWLRDQFAADDARR